ncbi:uncharacterized protein SCHCODRAFT_02661149 [Schizophyllum commune H4-8]|nr:uncharacterized protein SCHCODRAFT_02661149 [Schizophyllum commune H4-8]KAI5899528.1 hypothetical protein SCHCODRAFT_02661149 [Schizophyllum commune H4-8]
MSSVITASAPWWKVVSPGDVPTNAQHRYHLFAQRLQDSPALSTNSAFDVHASGSVANVGVLAMVALLSQAAEVEEVETALQRTLCGRVNESKLLSVAIFELIECHRPAFNVIKGEFGEAAVLALEAYILSSGQEYAGLLHEIEQKAAGDSRPCYILPVCQQLAPEAAMARRNSITKTLRGQSDQIARFLREFIAKRALVQPRSEATPDTTSSLLDAVRDASQHGADKISQATDVLTALRMNCSVADATCRMFGNRLKSVQADLFRVGDISAQLQVAAGKVVAHRWNEHGLGCKEGEQSASAALLIMAAQASKRKRVRVACDDAPSRRTRSKGCTQTSGYNTRSRAAPAPVAGRRHVAKVPFVKRKSVRRSSACAAAPQIDSVSARLPVLYGLVRGRA